MLLPFYAQFIRKFPNRQQFLFLSASRRFFSKRGQIGEMVTVNVLRHLSPAPPSTSSPSSTPAPKPGPDRSAPALLLAWHRPSRDSPRSKSPAFQGLRCGRGSPSSCITDTTTSTSCDWWPPHKWCSSIALATPSSTRPGLLGRLFVGCRHRRLSHARFCRLPHLRRLARRAGDHRAILQPGASAQLRTRGAQRLLVDDRRGEKGGCLRGLRRRPFIAARRIRLRCRGLRSLLMGSTWTIHRLPRLLDGRESGFTNHLGSRQIIQRHQAEAKPASRLHVVELVEGLPVPCYFDHDTGESG